MKAYREHTRLLQTQFAQAESAQHTTSLSDLLAKRAWGNALAILFE